MTKREKLVENYLEYTKLIHKMGGATLRLCRHPDATDEQILTTIMRYREAVAVHRKARIQVLQACTKHIKLWETVANAPHF